MVKIKNVSAQLRNLRQHSAFMEIIRYGITGVLTTAVNYAVYALVRQFMGNAPSSLSLFLAVSVAWVASVLFAYWANRTFVFHTSHVRGKAMWKEAGLFAAARIVSLGLDAVFLEIAVMHLGMNEYAAKLASNILVIIANYFASKLVIFKKKG